MTDEPAGLGLEDILTSAAEGLADVGREGPVWRVGDVPFATLAGDRAEFRLDPLVARAALRTPDTAASSRGSG